MNFNNILNEIAKADPEVFEKTDERRNVIRNFTRKVALTALPFALGATFKKAYAQSPNTIIVDTLNFALDLENLEAAFYMEAMNKVLFPNDEVRAAFTTITEHEQAHVRFLKNTIISMGGTINTVPGYDFTLQNTLDPFNDFATLLTVAQVLEDTGVRAYKGQAANLATNNSVLTAALNIHSMEARHASYIRLLRTTITGGTATVKPWITGSQTGIAGNSFKSSYTGEGTVTQAGIGITGIGGQNISSNAASEAFDEPLSKDEILAIVKPFIVA